MIEVLPKRLFIARKDVFVKADVTGMTFVIDLSGDPKLLGSPKDHCIYTYWNVGDDLSETLFQAMVRFCSAILVQDGSSVLVVGHQDTIDVVAACVIMENLGVKPEIAVSILRESRPKCLNRSELLETVLGYHIS